MTQFQVLFT